jgi:hypothetical protein
MTTPLTAIRDRLAAVNWLPWRYVGPSSPDGDMMSIYGKPAHILSVDADTRQEPNLIFIAHAPDDIAYLLRVAEAAQNLEWALMQKEGVHLARATLHTALEGE